MKERPDILWRSVVRGGMTQFRGSDEAFADFAAEQYARQKAERSSIGIYVTSVALLTCGRLDVVEDILDNIPPGRQSARILAQSIEGLLPVEKGTDVLYKTEAFRAWFRKNRPFLEWSPDEGRFVRKRPQE